MTGKRAPSPPRHLRPATRRWFTWAVETFEIEEHDRKRLQACSEMWDRRQEAREVIAKEGAYYTDRFGAPKAHPAVAVERDATIAFVRLLRELRLDVEPDDPRIPGLNGGRARA